MVEQVGDGTRAGKQPAAPGASQPPGQSGEGSRSAMEQLIRQEQKRAAQRPREGGAPAETGRGP